MSSEVDLANRALSLLGERRISSLMDDSKAARAMQARIAPLRDAELSTNAWRFAIHRAHLPMLAEVPAWGFPRAFQRPADDLRPLLVGPWHAAAAPYGSGAGTEHFEIIGDQIQTHYGAPLQYEYVRRVTDPSKYSPTFFEALAARIALDAAEEITGTSSVAQVVDRIYTAAIAEAKRQNGLWRPAIRRVPGPLVMARM